MKNKTKKFVFFGTPKFALPALKALHKEGYHIVLVVTQPDKPIGRKQELTSPAVKDLALNLNIEVIQELKIERLKEYQADLGIVVAYGKIIPKAILELFPLGVINIHPSLLPKYRGPCPIQTAILNGDNETGVTIIKLDEKMDHGPILGNMKLEVKSSETAEELEERLAKVSADLLIKILPDYVEGKIKLIPQNDAQATFTKILKREDGKIDWQKSAKEIERQIRAFYPWPGSFAEVKLQNLKVTKILSAHISKEKCGSIGKLQNKNGKLIVQTGESCLVIEKLQPEGKKVMSSKEFINGYLN